MPTNIGTQTTTYTTSAFDTFVLQQSDSIFIAAFGPGILNDSFSGVSVHIAGSIFGDNLAVRAWDGADNMNVLVTATGTATGDSFGIAADFANGLSGADNMTVINHGTVAGYSNSGFYSSSSDTSFTNTGSVFGGMSGVNFDGLSTNGTLHNSGTISGAVGVNVVGTSVTINNSGLIHSDDTGFGGTIGVGISVSGMVGVTLHNTGTISGGINAFEGGTGVELIYNSGTMIGNVLLSGGDDVYYGGGDGIVTGVIDLGSGADGAILGNAGGGVFGGIGDDTIRGGTGVDGIFGQGDNDDIRGRSGDDILDGGAGNDIVRAGRGDDELSGGAGNDFMRGGAGEDIINGGIGQDTMYGNGGADEFLYLTASESTNAGGQWDRIMDFTQGEDLIDLSAFNARFIGTGAYAANGNIAEVRIFEDPNNDTRVFVDVNADGVSDMRFYLVNTLGITADDFIL